MIELSLAISERLSDGDTIGRCFGFLASVEHGAGNPATAIADFRQALARLEQK